MKNPVYEADVKTVETALSAAVAQLCAKPDRHDSIKWPYEITVGEIECLVSDHRRDGKKQIDAGLNASGSYLVRCAESFQWCLDQIKAKPDSAEQVPIGYIKVCAVQILKEYLNS